MLSGQRRIGGGVIPAVIAGGILVLCGVTPIHDMVDRQKLAFQ